MSLDTIPRTAYNEDHEAFRQTVRAFMLKEVAPHADQWDRDKIVPRELWPKAGALGMLCPTVPEEYGGLGLDFGYNAIVDEEVAYTGGSPLGFRCNPTSSSTISCPTGPKSRKRHGCRGWYRVRRSPPSP